MLQVTVSIAGCKDQLTLFVSDNVEDVGSIRSTLVQVRDLLIEQGVGVCDPAGGEYVFLTPTGSIISTLQESLVTLEQVAWEIPRAVKKSNDNINDDDNGNLDLDDNEEEKFENLVSEDITGLRKQQHQAKRFLQIRIRPKKVSEQEECDGGSDSENSDLVVNGDEGNNGVGGRNTSGGSWDDGNRNQQRKKKKKEFLCPFRELKDVFNIHDYLQAKTLFKLVILAVVAMACLAVVLTCALQVLATSLSMLDLGGSTSFLHRPAPTQPGGTQGLPPEVELRLQKAELSVGYRLGEMEKRLSELEDMYLRDLKLHMQEMAELKAAVTDHLNLGTEGPDVNGSSSKDKKKQDKAHGHKKEKGQKKLP